MPALMPPTKATETRQRHANREGAYAIRVRSRSAAYFFSTDIAIAFPFHCASVVSDSGSVICGAMLLYLSWDVLRDQLHRGIW